MGLCSWGIVEVKVVMVAFPRGGTLEFPDQRQGEMRLDV